MYRIVPASKAVGRWAGLLEMERVAIGMKEAVTRARTIIGMTDSRRGWKRMRSRVNFLWKG
jgi:hypothetical protein